MRVPYCPNFLSGVFLAFLLIGMPAWGDGELPSLDQTGPRCEPQLHESGIEPFGRIFSVRAGQEISLPDFRLQAVAGTDAAQLLRVKRASGAEQMLALPERNDRATPVEFEVGGRHYVLEFNHTVLEHRALNSDELVVWPREEYRAALGAPITH